MPILGIVASSNYQRVAPDTGAMFPLGMVSVGSAGASTITFSSIPSTYKHLQIRVIAKNTGAGTDGYIQLNSSNSVYRHQLYGTGSGSATASANSGIAYILFVPGTGSNYGTTILDILDANSTSKNKTVRALSGYDLNGSGTVGINSALFTDLTAITSITLTSAGTNFAEYSSFALYGIK